MEEGRWVDVPQTQGVHNLNVQQLMLRGVKCWDHEKINMLYVIFKVVAKSILYVQLLGVIQEDKLIWNEKRNCVYSVWSDYRKSMEGRILGRGPREKKQWVQLWKIKTPPKAKHLLWRICKDCLPTRILLRNHFVQCQEDCPLCSEVPEEEWHVLVECEGNREAWSAIGLEHILTPRLQIFKDIKDLIFYICCRESKEVAEKMVLLLWVLWQNRNNFMWNEPKITARQGLQAASVWDDWISVNGQVMSTNTTREQQPAAHAIEHWQPSRHGYLKCNIDANFLTTIDATCSGWCFRDSQGRFLLAGSNVIQERLNAIVGYALAMKETIVKLYKEDLSMLFLKVIHKSLLMSSLLDNKDTLSLLISNI